MNEFEELAKLQKQTGQIIKGKMIENLRNNRSVATGNLIRSIVVDTPEEPNTQGNLETVLEIKAWYGELVDKGIDPRGPGRQPPIERIRLPVATEILLRRFSIIFTLIICPVCFCSLANSSNSFIVAY